MLLGPFIEAGTIVASLSLVVTQAHTPLLQTTTSLAGNLIGLSNTPSSEQRHVEPTPTTTGATAASTMISLMPEPGSGPTPSASSSSGMNLGSIAALVAGLSSIVVSMIAVWQAICYPRREHRKKMQTYDVELQTAVVKQKAAEGLLEAAAEEPALRRTLVG
ncbi:hypothetical protein FRB97_009376 [Tulasnella sp. 331]|nr:hypothetical protein FRB97_009376 [Tulasnella sp. 331]